MKEAGTVIAASGLTASPRQRSQVAREKWEENWIAQQREVTAVLEQPARLSRTAVVMDGTQDTAMEQPPPTPGPRLQPDPDRRVPAALRAEPMHRETTQIVRGVRAEHFHVHSSVSPMQVSQRTAWMSAGEAANTQAVRAGPEARQYIRQFAFWREEASVDVAMRLRDPHRDANSVLGQLRHWLRESGMHLRKVLVNGRALSSEQPASRTPPMNERGSAVNRHM